MAVNKNARTYTHIKVNNEVPCGSPALRG